MDSNFKLIFRQDLQDCQDLFFLGFRKKPRKLQPPAAVKTSNKTLLGNISLSLKINDD